MSFTTMRTVFLLGTLGYVVSTGAIAQDPRADLFETKIRPVLAAKCYGCHSASAATPQGGLLLDSVTAIRRGGNSGIAVQPGDTSRSLLFRALQHTDKNLKMPPGQPLAPEVVADFETWIRTGAVMPNEQAKAEPKKESALWSL